MTKMFENERMNKNLLHFFKFLTLFHLHKFMEQLTPSLGGTSAPGKVNTTSTKPAIVLRKRKINDPNV